MLALTHLLADEKEADVVQLIHRDLALLDLVDKVVSEVGQKRCIRAQ